MDEISTILLSDMLFRGKILNSFKELDYVYIALMKAHWNEE